MAQMKELQNKAAELGFTIKKGPTKFSGYILKRLNVPKQSAPETKRARKETIDHLIDNEEELQQEYELQVDEYPLGSDYKWSLADIEDYLESVASDIAAGRIKPSDDDDAEPEVEINLEKVKPASSADMRESLGGHENANQIKPLVGNAKAVTPKPTVTLHDLNLEVRALKSRDEFNPNWNDVGGHNVNENDEADGGHALREYRESVERENRNLIPPDKGTPDFTAPKAATTFVVTSKKCRVKKADISPKARTLLTIEIAIRAAQLKGDKAGIGKLP